MSCLMFDDEPVAGLNTQNLWILNGHTPSSTGSATWDTDARVANSVLLSVQAKASDGWYYILAQTSGLASVAQKSNGYPSLYIQSSTFYDKDCRAIYMQIS